MAHDGQTGQPFAVEARDYLRTLLEKQPITIRLHSCDQYGRVLASVYVPRFYFWRTNVGLKLVEAGLATVYQASGAQYGGIKDQLIAAEQRAKKKGKGIWSKQLTNNDTPAEYKRKLRSIQ